MYRCDNCVCKGVQGSVRVCVCTGGAYIAAKGCVCACMRVRLSVQWLDCTVQESRNLLYGPMFEPLNPETIDPTKFIKFQKIHENWIFYISHVNIASSKDV